jgi:hypothetical protein
VLDWVQGKLIEPRLGEGFTGIVAKKILSLHSLKIFGLLAVAFSVLVEMAAYEQQIIRKERDKVWQSWSSNTCAETDPRLRDKGIVPRGCPPVARIGIDP